jgi:hypothetical protein
MILSLAKDAIQAWSCEKPLKVKTLAMNFGGAVRFQNVEVWLRG